MFVATTLPELHAALLPGQGDARRPRVLVPTMGALHAGHAALVQAARARAGFVVASIFVNPLQFENTADFTRYPKDATADLAVLSDAGCGLVWMPEPEVMFLPGEATTVQVGGPAGGWEGAMRPGHFRGVATVVAKLLGQVQPDIALFGEKDWQQLQVVRRMVADLCVGVRIDAVPTVREPDGLAMSSRNRFLTPQQRACAPLLFAALRDVATQLERAAPAGPAIGAAEASLAAAGFAVEYLALVDGSSMIAIDAPRPGARLIAAAALGSVRLLDNLAVLPPQA